ncbi:odorant receptor 43a [Monomorium pharaonis]|uniref:odorant receptor 43a n=1 Tax=Monomorium pharaonis TaxID=307658 RepID=UPI00174640ED|nr:odorant receptor 43a [Monomorium pharaonis]
MDTSISGYQDFEWAVKLNRFTLKVIGLWPKSKYNIQEKLTYNSRPLITLIILICNLIPLIHSLIRVHSDITLVIDNLQFTLPTITCAVRIIIFWWKKKDILSILNMIMEDWLRLKNKYERTTMIRRAQNARIIITFAYGVMTIGFVFIVVLPICGISIRHLTNVTDPGKLLPLQTYYPYDVSKRPQYELIFFTQCIAIFLSIVSYTGVDNFLGLLVFHICGQLEILRYRIMHMNNCINFHDVLKSSVINHIRLLRAIAIIDDTYNIILLVLFLYFAIFSACYGFLIINLIEKKNDVSITDLTYKICVFINVFGHMCVYCAVGEILVAQCDRIYSAINNYKWYNLDPQSAKCLIFLLIRSNKSSYLTAGKVFPMTMATFCNLIKTSASYMSVLLTTKT